jgi:predicted transcriptional regulator
MDLSLIQKDILITLITLYHQQSRPIKGEEIAEVIQRNPGTVRNQMQALKAIGLVDGVPGPKGGYTPSSVAYEALNLGGGEGVYDVIISRNGEVVKGVTVSEIDFTTLCHPDVCHALNKLLDRGEIFGKDEVAQSLLISIYEMISLPKKPIRRYMSTPLISLDPQRSLRDALHIFNTHHIRGAPVIDGDDLVGIVTMSDIARAIEEGLPLDQAVSGVMTTDVVKVPGDVHLFEVIRRFKEREIGRLIVVEGGRPAGILTQSDIIRVFPSL